MRKDPIHLLHERALIASRQYRESELELISVLKEMEECRGYKRFKCKDLFNYATKELKLSESVAYTITRIAKRSLAVPALGEKVVSQKITIANARMLVPILSQDNQAHWLGLGEKLSKRMLEREIKKAYPEKAVEERARFVSDGRLELKLGVTEEAYRLFQRAQEILCQRRAKSVAPGEVLAALAEEFVNRHDPVRKAERARSRSAVRTADRSREEKAQSRSQAEHQAQTQTQTQTQTQASAVSTTTAPAGTAPALATTTVTTTGIGTASITRTPTAFVSSEDKECPKNPVSQPRLMQSKPNLVPGPNLQFHSAKTPRKRYSAALMHGIHLRDHGQCVIRDESGNRCPERKWTDFHHIIRVSQGGQDHLDNMITVCRAHHQMVHELGLSGRELERMVYAQ